MVIDWLAAGVDPSQATLFIQSRVPEHAELHTAAVDDHAAGLAGARADLQGPAGEAADRDLSTYGFLGYPLLQSADILIYRATLVPVGEDQVPHVEFTREIARRFNHLYGREPGFEEKAEGRGEETRQQARQALPGAAHALPGAGRRRGAGGRRARCWTRRRTCPWATASACSAISRAAAR